MAATVQMAAAYETVADLLAVGLVPEAPPVGESPALSIACGARFDPAALPARYPRITVLRLCTALDEWMNGPTNKIVCNN